GLGDPQSVEGEQVYQGAGAGGVGGGGVEDAAELVAGQPDGGGVVGDLWGLFDFPRGGAWSCC
ncbi:MAG: hypothetical protein QOH03_5219, partial [Kribbellaceae bacterium]|nr:hypothetical protein [Kribbellaceae bacterium]